MKNTAMQYIDVLSLTETKLDDTLVSSQPNKSFFSSTIKFQKKKKKKFKKRWAHHEQKIFDLFRKERFQGKIYTIFQFTVSLVSSFYEK